MPLVLPPISRRRFLAGSMLGALSLALRRAFSALPASGEPDSWALLSDTHLAADRSFVFRGANMTEHFRSVTRDLLGVAHRPSQVLITGDLAYSSGEVADYGRLDSLLEPIRKGGLPVCLALGNHDNRERFWNYFLEERNAPHPVVTKQTAVLPTARANWYILDSLEATSSTPGLLGREQLDWLARALDAEPGRPALVVVHHNPGITGNLGLKDTVALFEVIRPRKQVKAYIYGHTHSWKIEQDGSGIHLVNLPAVSYNFVEGEPTGWVQARVSEAGMTLELRCVDQKDKRHGQTKELRWR